MIKQLLGFFLALSMLHSLPHQEVFASDEQSILFPADANTADGSHNNNTPFWRGEGTTGRMQIVYGATIFNDLPRPRELQEIRFRPNASQGPDNAFSALIPNITVMLSTTPQSPDALSTVFEENTGADNVVVFQGDLPISSQFQSTSNGLREFDAVLSLETPFLYDPLEGNLLLDVIYPSGSGPLFQMDGVFDFNDEVSLVLQDTFATATRDTPLQSTSGPVTQFVFMVPEPQTLALFMASVLGIGLLRFQ